MKRPSVLLATAGDGDGAALMPKLYNAAGARVTVLSPHGFGISTSRYADERIDTPNGAAAVAERLREVVSRRPFDAVVLADDELLYEVYSAEPGALERYLSVPFALGTKLVCSKNAFVDACLAANIRVPAYEVCQSVDQAAEAARRIGYPVIVKLDQGYSGVGVRLIEDEAQLRALDEAGFLAPPFAVQQRIAGTAGTTSVLFDHGKPVVIGSAYYKRSWPTPFHPPTVRELTCMPELEEIARAVGAMTNYNGFGGVDWMQERETGKIFVLEMNARPMPMHVIAPFLKPYANALRKLLAGERIDTTHVCGRTGQRYYAFPKDVYRVLDERDIRGVLRWMARLPLSRGVVPWDDPPLMTLQLRKLGAFISRRFAYRTALTAKRWTTSSGPPEPAQ